MIPILLLTWSFYPCMGIRSGIGIKAPTLKSMYVLTSRFHIGVRLFLKGNRAAQHCATFLKVPLMWLKDAWVLVANRHFTALLGGSPEVTNFIQFKP